MPACKSLQYFLHVHPTDCSIVCVCVGWVSGGSGLAALHESLCSFRSNSWCHLKRSHLFDTEIRWLQPRGAPEGQIAQFRLPTAQPIALIHKQRLSYCPLPSLIILCRPSLIHCSPFFLHLERYILYRVCVYLYIFIFICAYVYKGLSMP